MHFKKRGLSEVVTTVIIILLVLVAIGIIWAVVNPTIRGTTQQIKSECLTISLTPLSCAIDLSNPGAPKLNVVAKRDAGAGTLLGMRLLLVNNRQETIAQPGRPVLGLSTELASQNYTITLADVTATGGDLLSFLGGTPTALPIKFNLAAEVEGKVCDPLAQAVTCA